MKIEIKSCDFPFPISDSLRSYISSSVTIALIQKAEFIQRVLVQLSHVNNSCSWADKCCAIKVELLNGSELVIENTEMDLYAAINRATSRTKYTLRQRLLVQVNNENVYKLNDEIHAVE